STFAPENDVTLTPGELRGPALKRRPMGMNKRNLKEGRRRARMPAAGAVMAINSQGFPVYSFKRMPAVSPRSGGIILYVAVNLPKMPVIRMSVSRRSA
ncbi:MAG: hypothetical protein L0213_05285, partial [Candidatus Dadabacteria bacterium]|nr:hypothetical protein [Candidatus Dadabacteria bacterium]